jgi:hypothetical protein
VSDRNRKEQLGARLRPGVRDLAVDAARRAGQSLNEWVENIILAAVNVDPAVPIVPAPLEGRMALTDFVGEAPSAVGTATDGAGGNATGGVPAPTKTFAADCSMREYHWRCRPGNPCKRCGGET